MSNETTRTSQTALVATEKLMVGAIEANLPDKPVHRLLSWDSLDGANADKKNYPVESDLGAASGGTEGTDLTSNTEIGMGATKAVTTSEGVAIKAVITEKTVRKRLGGLGFSTVLGAFQSEDIGALTTLLAPEVRRMTAMAMQKIEADCIAILDDASNSVGSTGVDIGISTMLQAIYQAETQQMHLPRSQRGFVLTPNQVHELNLEAAVTGGGYGGGLWSQNIDYSLFNAPGDEAMMDGLRGSFAGYRVYQYDSELALSVNGGADVGGFFGCLGSPNRSPDSYGGKVPYGVLLWDQPLTFRFQYDASLRAMEIIPTAEYAASELVDNNGVSIVSDAP